MGKNEEKQKVEETDDGCIFIDGVCVAEPGSDADFDRYSVEVQNGEGFYDELGHYRSYGGD